MTTKLHSPAALVITVTALGLNLVPKLRMTSDSLAAPSLLTSAGISGSREESAAKSLGLQGLSGSYRYLSSRDGFHHPRVTGVDVHGKRSTVPKRHSDQPASKSSPDTALNP